MNDTTSVSSLLDDFSTMEMALFVVVLGIIVISTLAALLLSSVMILTQGIRTPGEYATFVSGSATVVLVVLTGWYTVETRRMARETEIARQEEKEWRKKKDEMSRDKLRRGLLGEVRRTEGLDSFAEEYSPFMSYAGDIIPRTVYSQNAGEIGKLTEEEISIVVDYYTQVQMIDTAMKMQNQYDISAQRGLKEILFSQSHSLKQRQGAEERADEVRELIYDLIETRDEVISTLENNLNDTADGSSSEGTEKDSRRESG
ncbi:hypothetical protein [Salinirubrum litoreum]|uniref:5-bromo-4-chloroindolyl phosphate hydrolysis protein n=1 Tax=Salinirubrum litoreum TaxID=1126234 RepID=A0ABD5RBC3_9EURY|nr:hypothetical protein [Salinirubrum litoreum]